MGSEIVSIDFPRNRTRINIAIIFLIAFRVKFLRGLFDRHSVIRIALRTAKSDMFLCKTKKLNIISFRTCKSMNVQVQRHIKKTY